MVVTEVESVSFSDPVFTQLFGGRTVVSLQNSWSNSSILRRSFAEFRETPTFCHLTNIQHSLDALSLCNKLIVCRGGANTSSFLRDRSNRSVKKQNRVSILWLTILWVRVVTGVIWRHKTCTSITAEAESRITVVMTFSKFRLPLVFQQNFFAVVTGSRTGFWISDLQRSCGRVPWV